MAAPAISMRSGSVLALALVLLAASPAGARGSGSVAPAQPRGAVFRVQVDKSHALDDHRLEVRMSRPAGKIQLTVKSDDGATIAELEQDFTGKPANAPLVLTWEQKPEQPTGTIHLRMFDREDHFIEQEYSAWYVPIPHEEVNFRTDSADIDDSEVSKLDEAYAKIQEVLAKDQARDHRNLTLYIAGHTDTVGNGGYNLKLSQARAQSLARWFRQKGVRIPIAFEGFGETALRVKTPDQTDEPKNRRADYIIADDVPPMKTTAFRPSWKRIK